jgi:hypothetical protein
MRIDGLDAVMRLADVLSKAPSGAIPEMLAGNPAALFAVIATGVEMGIGPMEAIRNIHMVEGKPTLGASLMLAQAIRRGVKVEWVRKDAEVAHARFSRPGYPNHEEKITMVEIKAAGIDQGKSGVKKNWRSFPTAMLTARCVSRAMTAWAPDVLGAGVYVEGENEADQPEPRKTVDVEVIAKPADPIGEEVVRIIRALDGAQLEQQARDAWALAKLIWRKLSEEQIATLEAAKDRAKNRISGAPVDHDEAAAIAAAEREEAAQ